MPIRPPRWDDVRFDHHLAAVAATTLRQTGAAVHAAAAHRAALGAQASRGWAGPAHEVFVRGLAHAQADAGRLATLLTEQAAEIDRAAENAHAEQRRRLDDRERYRRERVALARREAYAARHGRAA